MEQNFLTSYALNFTTTVSYQLPQKFTGSRYAGLPKSTFLSMLGAYFEEQNINSNLCKISIFASNIADDALDWFLDYLDTQTSLKTLRYSEVVYQLNRSFCYLEPETRECGTAFASIFPH